ncbi:hypothetical protein AA313_de0209551 [Arthrobotrys entomopaga]|nr:hypothetical protein AA313_de0209551 [Arthrobotrys entomopaga]
MGDNPVADISHPPPAGLKDMSPETEKRWSLWMEMVYDALIHPRKYEVLCDENGWTHPQLKDIDPTNDLCRELKEIKKGKPNPDCWKVRKELTHFLNRNDPKNKDKEWGHTKIFWPGFPRIMNWAVFLGSSKVDKEKHLLSLSVEKSDLRWLDAESGDGNNIFWAADEYRVYQDEYFEWATTRDKDGRLVKVTFTCEGPEYWQMISKYEPETVVKLYKEMVPESEKHKITKEALWHTDPDGNHVYNTENEWNSPHPTNGCIAHLIHPNSTLSAEVGIAADGTVKRDKKFEDNAELLCAHGGFGEPYRNSDPKIGWKAYNACDLKSPSGEHATAITLAEPVGLYIQNWNDGKFIAPKPGFDMKKCWHPKRLSPDPDMFPDPETKGPWVRVEFYVPEEYGFILEDMQVVSDNYGTYKKLRYGSQIAQHINIGVAVCSTAIDTAIQPAEDLNDWERLTEVIKDPSQEDEHDMEYSLFLHYMQYKAVSKANLSPDPRSPWYRWVTNYPDLVYAKKKEGGHDGKPFPFPDPPITPDEGVGISGVANTAATNLRI